MIKAPIMADLPVYVFGRKPPRGEFPNILRNDALFPRFNEKMGHC
jgi:hypothetical protein